MKKIYAIMGICAAAALTLGTISCTKENPSGGKDGTPEMVKLTFSASIAAAGSPASGISSAGSSEASGKATLNGSHVVWQAGDQIGLFAFKYKTRNDGGIDYNLGDPANWPWHATSLGYRAGMGTTGTPNAIVMSDPLETGGGSTATFTFTVSSSEATTISNADYYVAVYPFRARDEVNDITYYTSYADKASSSPSSSPNYTYAFLRYVFPQEQTNADTHISCAYSTNRALEFKNLNSLIHFNTINTDVCKAVLTGNNGEILGYDKMKYSYEPGTFDKYNASSVAFTSITHTNVQPGDNYIALSPGVSLPNGFTITLYDSSDEIVCSFVYGSSYTTARGRLTSISHFDSRTDLKETLLLPGPDVNIALKNLAAGVDNCTTDSNNQTIKELRFVSGSDVVTTTVVSEPTSPKPVYASWDSANGIMTLSTPSFGKIYTGTDASYIFNIFVKLATVNLSNLGTDDATDLSSMFASCQCLTGLDVSVLNTSNVTNMKEMFRGVGYQSHPDHISFGGSFSMEKVTNAESMFASCYVRSLDLSSISAPVLSDARGMFYECKDLTSLALPSVTSALTLIENTRYSPSRGFLEGCTILSNLDMTGFNARPVHVRKMFKNCSSLDTITIPDGFDTSNCSYWSELFSGCSSLRTVNFPSLNIQSSKVSNSDVATKMQNAFNGVTQCLVYCRTDLSGAWYPDTAFSNGNIWPGFQAHWQLTQGTLEPNWSKYNVYFVYTNK